MEGLEYVYTSLFLVGFAFAHSGLNAVNLLVVAVFVADELLALFQAVFLSGLGNWPAIHALSDTFLAGPPGHDRQSKAWPTPVMTCSWWSRGFLR